jgi:ABC-2 type transport system ATP-binding protein
MKLLQLIHLSKSYGKIKALNDLNLEVHAGEVFGLLGPNGAGKTTTIHLIAGLIKPDDGQIVYREQNADLSIPDIKGSIGICYQENVHWTKLTPREQLSFLGSMYGMEPRRIRERCQTLLDALELSDVAQRLAGKLSGGQQRRLNIALALIHDPELIILDEPEAGLDPQSRVKVREFLRSLARSRTVILTTHNMDEAERMADRVAIIDHGNLLVVDTPRGLMERIGQGDVLEITLQNAPPTEINLDLSPQIDTMWVDDLLLIRGLDLVNRLPVILSRLQAHRLKAGEIRLRKNTLEDVFIQLTGRRLRE